MKSLGELDVRQLSSASRERLRTIVYVSVDFRPTVPVTEVWNRCPLEPNFRPRAPKLHHSYPIIIADKLLCTGFSPLPLCRITAELLLEQQLYLKRTVYGSQPCPGYQN